MFRLTLQ
ncbi:hypothetical protein D047_0604A, partial [Vibrio parahaemolyticus VPTS-2010_2]